MSDPDRPRPRSGAARAGARRRLGARRVVDATLGDGGHAAALLASGVELLGIDRDPEAIAGAGAGLETRGFNT